MLMLWLSSKDSDFRLDIYHCRKMLTLLSLVTGHATKARCFWWATCEEAQWKLFKCCSGSAVEMCLVEPIKLRNPRNFLQRCHKYPHLFRSKWCCHLWRVAGKCTRCHVCNLSSQFEQLYCLYFPLYSCSKIMRLQGSCVDSNSPLG